jgi:hypothetical protein
MRRGGVVVNGNLRSRSASLYKTLFATDTNTTQIIVVVAELALLVDQLLQPTTNFNNNNLSF